VLDADVVQSLSPTMTSFSARSRGADANSVGGEGRCTVNGKVSVEILPQNVLP
jgi:hypothetical protein